MKYHHLLLIVTIVFSPALAFGQNRFFVTEKNAIIDLTTYDKLKVDYLNSVKQLLPEQSDKIKIVDNLKQIRRTKDSLIYSYKWSLHIGDMKAEKNKTFEPDSLLNKKFVLPTLTTLSGTNINFRYLKGKPALINFWFTTCQPCIDEMPILNTLKKQLKDSVNFIAITYEPTDEVRKFLKKHKFNFLQITNAKKFVSSMNMKSFPINIFLDKNGVVRRIENGIPYIIGEKGDAKMSDGKEFLGALRDLL
jgi:thiol-disulfide isomerase/thioredoxin